MTDEILIFDTETGGLHPDTNGLCTVSFKVFGKPVSEKFIIKPNKDKEYVDRAFQVNGLSLRFLEEKGKNPRDVIIDMLTFIKKNFKGKPNILGQNIQFDMRFMHKFFNENGFTLLSYIWPQARDTMVNSLFLKDLGLIPEGKKINLSNMYKFLTGEKVLDAHDSSADVLMTERVYVEQLKLITAHITAHIGGKFEAVDKIAEYYADKTESWKN